MQSPRTLLLLVSLSALLMGGGSCSFGSSSGSNRGVVIIGGCRAGTNCESPPPTSEDGTEQLGAASASASGASEGARGAAASFASLRGPAPELRAQDDPAATVPEPRASLAFAIGALLCVLRLRCRRSRTPAAAGGAVS